MDSATPAPLASERLHEMARELREFSLSCATSVWDFCLTRHAEPTAYALCFGVFVLHLTGGLGRIDDKRLLARRLASSVRDERARRRQRPQDKPYRQLLTFCLSALKVLNAHRDELLEDLVKEQIGCVLESELKKLGCLHGRAGSGNQAMFLAIFLIHARDQLGVNTQPRIEEWVALHQEHMNRFGFWGNEKGMTYLQFQNGYHQHEIFEYLGVENPRLVETLAAVRALADAEGHFAPYPGGGGCYDYDAVFMLTPEGRVPDEETRAVLLRSASTILSEQREDGGFAESIRVRPRSLDNQRRFVSHLFDAAGKGPAFFERLRYGLALQRPKHDRIRTHWSEYSRRWDESDLWDSWFRALALARIDVALCPERASHWGFIDYPGIGYHPSLRATTRAE